MFAQTDPPSASQDEPTAEQQTPARSAVVIPIGPSLLPDPPSGWADPLTGLNGPDLWDRIVAVERARVRRYKRPVTIAFVEVVGLDELTRQWGRAVSDRALVFAARTVAAEARSSDLVARIKPTRLGVILTETTEIAAINFIERARAACEEGMASTSGVLHVAFGWASPPPNRDLMDAIALANDRLSSEIAQVR